jgi:hypothetical protein
MFAQMNRYENDMGKLENPYSYLLKDQEIRLTYYLIAFYNFKYYNTSNFKTSEFIYDTNALIKI